VKPENPLRKDDWMVDTCSLEQATDLVKRLHYAAGAANTAVFRFGLYDKRDWPLCVSGCTLWIPPTRTAAVASLRQADLPISGWQRVLSLSRLVIEPHVPTNGASFLLGQSIRKIAQCGQWDLLVTYADEWQGHTGAIYRASNWKYVGRTKPERVYARDGVMVARKAGPTTRTHAAMEALGAEVIAKSAKHKFVKVLA
jgi:hypothetical protein